MKRAQANIIVATSGQPVCGELVLKPRQADGKGVKHRMTAITTVRIAFLRPSTESPKSPLHYAY